MFFDARRLDSFAMEVTVLDEKPNETREWGSIGRLGIPYRCDYAVKIEAYADSNRNHDDDKDNAVDLQDEVTKAQEEEYERYVDKPEDNLRQYR